MKERGLDIIDEYTSQRGSQQFIGTILHARAADLTKGSIKLGPLLDLYSSTAGFELVYTTLTTLNGTDSIESDVVVVPSVKTSSSYSQQSCQSTVTTMT